MALSPRTIVSSWPLRKPKTAR